MVKEIQYRDIDNDISLFSVGDSTYNIRVVKTGCADVWSHDASNKSISTSMLFTRTLGIVCPSFALLAIFHGIVREIRLFQPRKTVASAMVHELHGGTSRRFR